MSGLSRREAVGVVAALGVGVGIGCPEVMAGEKTKGSEVKPVDSMLFSANRDPQAFMFVEQVTFQIETDGASRDLFITSALDQQGKSVQVRVPSRSMRIFRADASKDAFTQKGGIYWSFRKSEGKIQFKEVGAVVMVVREDNTVRCYTLDHDVRC